MIFQYLQLLVPMRPRLIDGNNEDGTCKKKKKRRAIPSGCGYHLADEIVMFMRVIKTY